MNLGKVFDKMQTTKGVTLWLTGLSGAGKSTIAARVTQELIRHNFRTETLDGDAVRMNLSKGLGFSREDRDTNIARIAYVCSLLTRNGVIVISAAISPYAEARAKARETIGEFVEVFVKCSLDKTIERDVKGLYQKALDGKIENFTGVSDPYEEPSDPEIVVDTEFETVDESIRKIFAFLALRGYIDSALELSA